MTAVDAQKGRRAEWFRRRFPTLDALTGPFRNRRGGLKPAALLLLTAVAAPAVWWAVQLVGLPDVGEPFDVAAFCAETIPDVRNAFVAYRRAAARYRPFAGGDGAVRQSEGFDARWATAPPEARAWLEANREALALFRDGAELPDALDASQLVPDVGFVRGPAVFRDGAGRPAAPGTPQTAPGAAFDQLEALRPFLPLALLEASRLESLGDMDGARAWYRTLLRATHHFALRARVRRRRNALLWHGQVAARWTAWAADPRTTPEQVRRAVDDINACGALAPSETYTIKSEYLDLRPYLNGTLPGGAPPPGWLIALRPLSTFGTGRPLLTTDHLQSLTAAWHVWRRELERVRRAVRLVTANRLAYYALPPDRRPAPEPSVALYDLYPLGPDAPPAARAVSPKALGRWVDSTVAAQRMIPASVGNRLRAQELANHQALLDVLTSELARRDAAPAP